MGALTVRQDIRDLQARYAAEYPDSHCFYGVCGHEHELTLPAGLVAIQTRDHRATGVRHLVTLVRFTRRRYGGWHVVRADNGRVLGWVTRVEYGEHRGSWSAHVSSGAFHGDGPDDDGDLLDDVGRHLYRGDPNNALMSQPVGFERSRRDAADEVVRWLTEKAAPALGFGAHWDVRPWRARAGR